MRYTIVYSCEMDTNVNPDAAAIDAAGGVTAVAKLLEVETNVVGNWKARGIPKPWRKLLAGLRPDIDWTRADQPAERQAA